MEAVLSEAWLAGLDAEPVRDDASVALLRARVRELGEQAGIAREPLVGLCTAASELGHNALRHGRDGWAAARLVTRGDVPGVEVAVADRGRGIQDPRAALQRPSAPPAGQTSLGTGLSGARRLSDEIDLDVRLGEGTCVRVRSFARPVAASFEVGALGRPAGGEVVSGDDALAALEADAALLALVDGLGHGPEARVASARAVATTRATASRGLRDVCQVLRDCDAALAGTRGAVMTAVCLPLAPAGDLVLAGAGNVTALLHEGHARRRGFVTTSRVLGRDPAGWRPRAETAALSGEERVLVLFTDGLSGRASLDGDAALLRQHPVATAQALLERFGQAHDDALVVVVKQKLRTTSPPP